MKTLLAILFLSALSVQAAVTNITVRVTTEIAGVGTNSTSVKFQQDGSNKDALTVDALVWTWTNYKATGVYTNDFDTWLRDTARVAFQAYNPAKSANDLGAAVAKVAAAASTDSSLLTQAQKNQLIAIANSLP